MSESLASWLDGTEGAVGLVFSDVVDSTAILFTRETVAFRTLLRRHRAQVTRLAEEHGGRVIDATGDGIFAAFKSVGGAFDYATGLHREPGAAGLHVRVGVHVGSVRQDGEALVGRSVHLAARVMQRGEGAEIWVSDAAREALASDRADRSSEIAWLDSDDCALKGIPGVYKLWRAV